MSVFCYQVNKSANGCKNLVSREHDYICAAGHGKNSKTASPLKEATSDVPTFVRAIRLLDVASSQMTSIEELMRLATNREQIVRERVAQNPRTPILSQMILASDACEDVQLGLFVNREPEELDDMVLEILMRSNFESVREASIDWHSKTQ